MLLAPRKPVRNQRGSILIWLALFMIVILGFMSLAVDGAKLMATRTQLQNAADGAALAGASAINYADATIQQDSAAIRAKQISYSNKAFVGQLERIEGFETEVEFPDPQQCKVTVYRVGDRSIISHFAQVVGMPRMPISATATASISHTDCVTGLRPIGVGDFQANWTFTQGLEYTLVEGDGEGNWRLLDLSKIACEQMGYCDPNSGADYVRCLIIHGHGCCIEQEDELPVQTGAQIGPIRQAIDSLFSYDTVRDEYPDTQLNSYPIYKAAGGNDSRLITVPLVRFTTDSGNNRIGIVQGFAAFFLKRKFQHDTFYGEYVNAVVPGEPGGAQGNTFVITLIH